MKRCNLCLAALLTLAMGRANGDEYVSSVKKDEVVLFFPSVARWRGADKQWVANIHGIVFEPANRTEKLKLGTLRRLLGIRKDLTVAEKKIFQERGRSFIVDHERGKRIWIELNEKVRYIGKSGANGHFEGEIRIDKPESHRKKMSFSLVLPKKDLRVCSGTVRFVPAKGVSVISDVDDTIKISNVLDKKELLANTFYRPFKAVPGVSKKYQGWATDGISFHYVTGSPWQLYEPIWKFLAAEKFPRHDIQMRHLRLTDSSILQFFQDPLKYKIGRIEPILKSFPDRRFVLIGDSGERDPEVYGTLARQYPKQILGIMIRTVVKKHFNREQYKETFADIPPEKWLLFDDAKKLPSDLSKWTKQTAPDGAP